MRRGASAGRPRGCGRLEGRSPILLLSAARPAASHLFLIHRLALATFVAVYVFAQKCGNKRARLWPSVRRELRVAVALVPLVRSDLSRLVANIVARTDASTNGVEVVYTREGPHRDLRRDCMRPRTEPRDASDPWEVEQAWTAEFEAPLDLAAWRVAIRRCLRGPALCCSHQRQRIGGGGRCCEMCHSFSGHPALPLRAPVRLHGCGWCTQEGPILEAAVATALPPPCRDC